MTLTAINIALAFYIAYIFLTNKRYLHMLQLNSYMNSRYMKWFKGNYSKEISIRSIIPFLSIVFIVFQQYVAFLVIWICAYVYLYLKRIKIKEKKKFVVTDRVKRQYITTSAILVLLVLMANYLYLHFGKSELIVFLSIAALMGELKVIYALLANSINLPLEKAISNWYYNDAKRMLKQNKLLTVIGITGSYGKTSSKYILSRILSEKYNVLMTPESYNTLMGVVRTIREQLKPTHEIFVVEMGAKKKGDIQEICKLVKPKYGLLTSIGLQHLETFKSFNNIIETKFELIESLTIDGAAFLNFENEAIRCKKTDKLRISFGINNNALSYWAEEIKYDNRGSSFRLHSYKNEPFELKTRLLGMHNVLNIVGACAVALELGVSIEKICYAVRQLNAVPHRLELKGSSAGVTIIDDAFNSNPEGANEAINVLGKFDSSMKILITPGLVELGAREYDCNYNLGTKAAEVCDFIIMVGIKRSKPISEGLAAVSYPIEKTYVAKNLNEALEKMKTRATDGSVVLFENDLPDNYEE